MLEATESNNASSHTSFFLFVVSGILVESSTYFSSFNEDVSNITVTDSEMDTKPDDQDIIGDTQATETHTIQKNSSDSLTNDGSNNQQQPQQPQEQHLVSDGETNTLTNETTIASSNEEWSIQLIYGSQPEITSEPSQPPIDQDLKAEDQEWLTTTETNGFDFDYTNFHTEANPSNNENQSSMKPILFITLGSIIASIALGLALLFCAHMRNTSQDLTYYDDEDTNSSICTDDFSTAENKINAESSYRIQPVRGHSPSADRSQHSRCINFSDEQNPQDIDYHSTESKLSNQSSRSIDTSRSHHTTNTDHGKRSRLRSNKRAQIYGSRSNANNISRNYIHDAEDIPYNSEIFAYNNSVDHHEDILSCTEECSHDGDVYYDGGIPYRTETTYAYNHDSYTAHDISAGIATSDDISLFDDRSAKVFEEEVYDEVVYTSIT